jgi:chlorobactene glucosyltransferase
MFPDTFLDWYGLIYLLWSIWIGFITIPNIIWMFVNTKPPTRKNGPRVSILIPCRNEEDNIGRCLNSLLRQDYENFEIVVLDDNSEDSTWEIISNYASKHDNIKVFQGKPLPDDWNGYPHSMHQLAEHATGDILIFTDADTQHSKTSVSWGVTNILYHKVDFLSGYTRQIFASVGDAMVVINMFLNTVILLPLWLVKPTKSSSFAMGLGQYMCFKKESYFRYGGFETAKDKITCDVYMARELKRRGGKQIFLDAKAQVRCMMYHSFRDAVVGISRNIYYFFEQQAYPVYVLIPFVFAFMLMPPLVAVGLAIAGIHLPTTLIVGLLIVAVSWSLVLIDRRVPFYAILLYPMQFAVLIYIAFISVHNQRNGKRHIWKGRKCL